MSDISGSGTLVWLSATRTFPIGVPLLEGADDADPIESGVVEVSGQATTTNGKLVTWGKAAAIPLTLNVVPGGVDDLALSVLLDNNRVGLGKLNLRDVIFVRIVYPNGSFTELSKGAIISGPATDSVSSDGRKKTKAYTFAFQEKAGINVPGI